MISLKLKKISKLGISKFKRLIELGLIEDVMLIGGVASLTVGVHMIYKPAGFIVLGLCLMAGAYLVGRKGAKQC